MYQIRADGHGEQVRFAVATAPGADATWDTADDTISSYYTDT
jgi:hypothetical protein